MQNQPPVEGNLMISVHNRGKNTQREVPGFGTFALRVLAKPLKVHDPHIS